MSPRWVSIPEAARLIGVHRTTFHLLVVQGRVAGAEKVGRYWSVPLGRGGLPVVTRRPRGRPRKDATS